MPRYYCVIHDQVVEDFLDSNRIFGGCGKADCTEVLVRALDVQKGLQASLGENPLPRHPPRPSWDEYFLEFAKVAASRSTCLRAPDGVGAVLVRDKQVLATGFAGSIRGAGHCTEDGCLIDEKTGGCVRTVHAEVNAILQAAQHGTSIKGATLYTTMSPCWDCFKATVNGGVVRIVYLVEYRNVTRQKEFASKLGVEFEHYGDLKYVPGERSWS